jgi:aminobenzoyl-glutamate utilization protein B
MAANLTRLGPPEFDEEDRRIAAEFQKTMTEEDIASSWRRAGLPQRDGVSLCDTVIPLETKGVPMVGSTDVGDVSWKVPTVQARGATYAIGTPAIPGSSPLRASCRRRIRGMVHVAKVMAGHGGGCAARTPALIAAAKEDHRERTGGKPYQSPLPADAKPALDMSR